MAFESAGNMDGVADENWPETIRRMRGGPVASPPADRERTEPGPPMEAPIIDFMRRNSLTILRLALGVVFVWFGVLKLADASPVADLVADGLAFLPDRAAVVLTGSVETLIGIGLLSGRFLRLTLLLFFGLLAGTFVPVILHPSIAYQRANPLALTVTGEFVVKNLVLIAAGLTVVAAVPKRHEPDSAARIELPG